MIIRPPPRGDTHGGKKRALLSVYVHHVAAHHCPLRVHLAAHRPAPSLLPTGNCEYPRPHRVDTLCLPSSVPPPHSPVL